MNPFKYPFRLVCANAGFGSAMRMLPSAATPVATTKCDPELPRDRATRTGAPETTRSRMLFKSKALSAIVRLFDTNAPRAMRFTVCSVLAPNVTNPSQILLPWESVAQKDVRNWFSVRRIGQAVGLRQFAARLVIPQDRRRRGQQRAFVLDGIASVPQRSVHGLSQRWKIRQ